MRNVMVPFDGSDSARRALQYVIDYARDNRNPLKVHVINVQQEPVLFGEYVTGEMIEDLNNGLLAKSNEILSEAAGRLQEAGIDWQTHPALGNVPDQVRDLVAQLGCDTVVMGTRGLSSFSGLLLGSVATRVIHEVPVPVLLVK